ncbi:MAG: haloacid dehalogenase-like hydrolase [Clostridiales bacterium]|nr:haloacid dehalogenase-like hydrolase [Clostridiales bacterium]
MNGYDFDNTILDGNSTRRFAFFCTARLPYLIIFVPVIVIASLLRALRIISMNKYLHMLEWFIALVPNVDKFVIKFWDKNMKHIKPWYLSQRHDDDIVISASPYFLVVEACKRLGVACIATNLDTHARLNGHKHVYGKEKVTTYKIVYEDKPLTTYYSDSMSDIPMFMFAERGYFVKGHKVKLLYENGERVD